MKQPTIQATPKLSKESSSWLLKLITSANFTPEKQKALDLLSQKAEKSFSQKVPSFALKK